MVEIKNTYAVYKDSGAEWLGEVPEHWELTRLKNIFYESLTQNVDGKCKFNLSLLKDIGVIPFSEKGNKGNKSSLDTRNYRLVKKGDIVLNTTNVCIGSVGLSKYDGCMSSVMYIVLRPYIDLDIRYYSYIFKVRGFQKYLRRISNGILEIREYLNKTLFMAETMVIPSLAEQTAIANFLDDKTAKIDQAIAIKQKQIELLKERRQILIHKAVTRGLDENVKLKDSGVEWIGEIPEHWEVKKVKYLLKERNERSKDGSEPLFMMSQVHGLVVRSEYHSKAEVAQSSEGNKVVYKNDLVFNKLKAHLGVFFKSTIEFNGIVSPDYAVYNSTGVIKDLKFLELLFRNPEYIKEFICRATGIVEGLIRLYTADLFDIYVSVPPVEEQTEILEYIENANTKIATAISLKEQEIEKLKEYKMSLIDSVVTGKVKIN